MSRRARALRHVWRRSRPAAIRPATRDALVAGRIILGRTGWNTKNRETLARLGRALVGFWSPERVARFGFLLANDQTFPQRGV